MSRQFSVIRRRPQIIDIVTPRVAGTTQYRIKWAALYSDVPTQIIAASPMGFLDTTVNQAVLQPVFNSDQVRIVFDPTNATYAITNPNKPFWLQFTRFNGAIETYVSPVTLILPDEANHGIGVTTLTGVAPNVVSVATSVQLDFPSLVSDLRVRNEGAVPIAVATEAGGDEMIIPKDMPPQQVSLVGSHPTLLLRGVGGTASVSLTFTRAYPR